MNPRTRRPRAAVALGTLAIALAAGTAAFRAVEPSPAGEAAAPAASRHTATARLQEPAPPPARAPLAASPAPSEPAIPIARRVRHRSDPLPGIAPPPAQSAEVRAIPRAAIPEDVYLRLMTRLARAEQNGQASGIDPFTKLPAVDPSVRGGIRRTFGPSRVVEPGGGEAPTARD